MPRRSEVILTVAKHLYRFMSCRSLTVEEAWADIPDALTRGVYIDAARVVVNQTLSLYGLRPGCKEDFGQCICVGEGMDTQLFPGSSFCSRCGGNDPCRAES